MAAEPEQLLLPCVPPKQPHQRRRKRRPGRRRQVRCGICGELGTNRRTCPAAGH